MQLLWKITEELKGIETILCSIEADDNFGEEQKQEEIERLLSLWMETGAKFEEKACHVANFIRQLQAIAKAQKEESKRIASLFEKNMAKIATLRKLLAEQMLATGKSKISSIDGTISIRKKGLQIKLKVNPEDLPEDYRKVLYSPDLRAIKKDINNLSNYAELIDGDEYVLYLR